MQVFKTQGQNQEEDLLRTAIELFERDKKESQHQGTVEQVLAELDIPLDYLDQARVELMKRQLLSQSRPAVANTHNRQLVVVAMATAVFCVFMTGAFQLYQNALAKAPVAPQQAPILVSPPPPVPFNSFTVTPWGLIPNISNDPVIIQQLVTPPADPSSGLTYK